MLLLVPPEDEDVVHLADYSLKPSQYCGHALLEMFWGA